MVALTRRYQSRLAAISGTAGVAVAVAWDDLPGYDRLDIPTFARRTARTFIAAKAATLAVAVGYYSLLAVVRPPAVNVEEIDVAPAVDDPFIGYWQALQAGHVWDEAVAIGRGRAEAAVTDYVTSTSRRTGDVVAERTGQDIVGWRRVLTGTSCAWCATVATQRYRTAESADFGHTRCDCTAAPIYGDSDPGRIINKPVLSTLKQKGEGYWKSGYVNPDGTPAPRADLTSRPARDAQPPATGGNP